MAPYGGEPRRGFDVEETLETTPEMFRSGEADLELVATYTSGDMAVLVAIERQHGEVGGMPDQDWSLRVTLVFQRVRLFDRYEYLLISLMNRLYWESPGVSGCFRQCPQWLLLVSVVSVVRAGKGRDGIRPRVPRVRGPCPG